MTEGTQRRLAAVLAADVVGYSSLMEADEVGTLAALKGLREELWEPMTKQYGGRVVGTAGDGILIEFASAVAAVESAIAVQRGMTGRAAGRMRVRIGINIGEVIVDGDDIYGEGVNLAARLEALCEPDEVAISANVHEQIAGKLDETFEDAGEHMVKNIARPVRVWRWTPGPVPMPIGEVAELAGGGLTREDKPAIAVLPFNNMSGDPEQEYFSDGIAEDLTTALSHFDWLFVIARNSAFAYKGRALDVRRVGKELGVRYILEGSVRKFGNRVRVNAQLVDAELDHHVWAHRFDQQMDDIFELQDSIVGSIAATVGPEITMAEIERARSKHPKTLRAWDYHLRALAAYNKTTRESVVEAITHLERAIEIEPGFSRAHALLALCHSQNGVYGWVRPVSDAYRAARQRAEEAVALAPTSPEAHQALAFVLMVTGNAPQAIVAARRAIDLNPNFAEAFSVMGHAQIFCGELEAGLESCLRAARNNPRDTRGSWLYDAMGHAYFMMGEYRRAIEISKKGLHQDPALIGALVTLAGAHAMLGEASEARRYVDDILRLIPRYSLTALARNPMFVAPDLIEKLLESMRLAGLPE